MESSKPTRPTRATRPTLSRSARRDVRQAVAMATELDLHSVMLHGVVWTLHHPKQLKQPKATLPSLPGTTVDSGMNTTLVAPGEVRGGSRRRSLQRAASSCSLPLSDHVRLSPSLPAVPPP